MQFDDIDGVKHYFSKTNDGGEEVFEIRDNNVELLDSVRNFIKSFIVDAYNSGDLSSLLSGIELSTDILDKKQFLYEKLTVTYRELPNGGMVIYSTDNHEAKSLLYSWFDFLFSSDLRNPTRKSLLTGDQISNKNADSTKNKYIVDELFISKGGLELSKESKILVEDIAKLFDANIEISNNRFIYIPIINKYTIDTVISILKASFSNYKVEDSNKIYSSKLNADIEIFAFKKEIESIMKNAISFSEIIPWQISYLTYMSNKSRSFFVTSIDNFI
jgi:hypothetical protein